MTFSKLKKIKIFSLILGSSSIIGGSISLPLILNKINKNKRKFVKQNKKIKEIKLPISKKEIISKNKEFKILKEISLNENKWNQFKNILIKNMNFDKNQFSWSNFNLQKLDNLYKINNLEGVKNVFYNIDRYETRDGELKIFGHIIKNDFKIILPPFLIQKFLTNKKYNINKINTLNKKWILDLIKIPKKIKDYENILSNNIKIKLLFDLQNKNYLNIGIKIKNFNIDFQNGNISYNVNLLYKNNLVKNIFIIHNNLQKDFDEKIKKINSKFLEDNIFKFLLNNKYINNENVDWIEKNNQIKKLPIIVKNNINVKILNKKYSPFIGEYNFQVEFTKNNYKKHLVNMYYTNFKKESYKILENIENIIRENDGIELVYGKGHLLDFEFEYLHNIKKCIHENYEGWGSYISYIENNDPDIFEYVVYLEHPEYKSYKLKILYETDFYQNIYYKDDWIEIFEYMKVNSIDNLTNEIIEEFLDQKYEYS